jgi:hypothetical protein
MTRSNSQGNGMSVIVIAVLFIALMATLGIVFYQNFIAKPVPVVQTQSTTSSVSATTTARIAFSNLIYDLDYPPGWMVARASDPTSSNLSVMNMSGTVRVTLNVSKNTIDTSCNSNDGLQISDYNVASVAVKSLVDVPVYLVESISDNTGGGYQYKIGLVPDGGDTNTSVGATHCTVSQVGIAATMLLNGQALVHPTVLATIDFPKLPAAPKAAAADLQTIRSLITSDDYKAATKIIESARKE